MIPILQSANIYDKFDALKSEGSGSVWWDVAALAFLTTAILVGFLATYRAILNYREAKSKDRRGRIKGKLRRKLNEESDHLISSHGDQGEFDLSLSSRNLGDVPAGSKVSVFWTEDGKRKRSAAKVMRREDNALGLSLGTADGLTEETGRLICAADSGDLIFFDVEIRAGNDDFEVQMSEGASAIRMRRKSRVPTGVQAAVRRGSEPVEGGAEGKSSHFVLRIHDMSFDGFGVLADEELTAKERLMIRVQFPGYADPFTSQAEVAWTRDDVAGLCRAGLSIIPQDIDNRSFIADFMLKIWLDSAKS